MRYEILTKESRFGDVIDFIKTKNAGNMYIVERNGCYRIRRVHSQKDGDFIWDLSNDAYNTLEEAESALLSCCVSFNIED